MIGRLHGTLAGRAVPRLLVDVNGVGYEVNVPLSVCERLPKTLGAEITLYIHMVVREDAQQLFGFASERERDVFRVLIGVSGVGPKMGLQMLSGMDVDALLRNVAEANLDALTAVPGIGKKTAGRLLVDLADGLSGFVPLSGADAAAAPPSDATRDAEKALVALGYKPALARRTVAALPAATRGLDSEALIREALRAMAP